ncbi:ubiquinol-cytochrome C reductase complex subunit oxen [Megalopta genalis]|uniref:ubiquinol-cytochrome C reductase complex subunit oxen n=1 Tax=Megalopta genalis TaxID=115081 RepID=UPI003FCF9F60
MAGISDALYNAIFKRSSTFAFTIMASAFIFERTVNLLSDTFFDNRNKGKLWKDIKHKYEQ